jgi:hypothetical protein
LRALAAWAIGILCIKCFERAFKRVADRFVASVFEVKTTKRSLVVVTRGDEIMASAE